LTWRRVLLIGCCAAWLLPAQTAGQSPDSNPDSNPNSNKDEAVYDIGPGVTPPRVIKQVNPRYSTSKGVRAVGSVIIALVVSSKGMPKDPHVVKGIDTDLDQSAVDAVKEWRFAPAQKNDKPIAVRVSVEIRFHEM
jgi:TonB family protein